MALAHAYPLRSNVKYSVRTKATPLVLFPFATIAAAYVLPLQNWVQIALLGVGAGAMAGFLGRGKVVRTFEPADAPIAAKRRVVAGFALARLVFGLGLILMSAALFAEWLAPVFLAGGGYLIGTTAATPLRDAELAGNGITQDEN